METDITRKRSYKESALRKLGITAVLLFLLSANCVHAQAGITLQPQLLIHSPETVFYLNPVWSPDGNKIAFTSDNYDGIWVADAEGRQIRLLSTDSGAGFGMAWAPDAQSIVSRPHVIQNRRRFHSITQYNLSDRSYERIQSEVRGIQGTPHWLPNGAGVVFVKDGSPQIIRTGSGSTSESTNKMLFYHLDKLQSLNPSDGSIELLADFDGRIIFNLAVSPEGNMAAFQVQGKGLFVMQSDGSGLKELGRAERASWLPGGQFIVAAVTEDDGQAVTSAHLVKIDVANGSRSQLTQPGAIKAMHPSVSPCGKWVVFDNPDNGAIYILGLE